MNYEIMDCIDAGTEYCPCHLAETGDCILCSQLSGKTFCDCINWKGVCIYQEYIWNKNKATEERKHYLCKIIEKEVVEENMVLYKIKVSHKLASELIYVGSYIFMRNPKCMQYYDAPISIMDSNTEEDWIKVVIELKGTKTRSIDLLGENDDILIRGPFWNGVFGLKNVLRAKDGTSLLIIRGIGQAPALPVLKKLSANNNKLIIVLDCSPYKKIFIEDWLEEMDAKVLQCRMIDKGELTEEFKELLVRLLNEEKPNLVHCAGADILSYKVLNVVGDNMPMSCCNNARMCCGEGICGSCTVKTNDHKLRRLCKLQTEPKYVLNGRRSL